MRSLILSALVLGFVAPAKAQVAEYQKYRAAVKKVSELSQDENLRNIVQAQGLNLLNVAWEDTGRGQNSALGPNISDVTIQVHTVGEDGNIVPVPMPILRYPNFDDFSADISPNKFSLLVGNEKGKDLKRITLTEYLDNFREYLTDASSWKGSAKSLLAPRDTEVLVSAQHTFLPIPKGQKAHFNPMIFNYQSSKDNPAVLAILATREGTSARIIDYSEEDEKFEGGFGRTGQRLFHNVNGEKASLTGERISDFVEGGGDSTTSVENAGNANIVLLIQVPLVHKAPLWRDGVFYEMADISRSSNGDIEEAVIGHGPIEGPFKEIGGKAIQRDPRFPIRVTVQFYQATANPKIDAQMVFEMEQQITSIYKEASAVGSLVTGGKTGRTTEHNVEFWRWNWWGPIWPYQYQTPDGAGISIGWQDAVQLLDEAYGNEWVRFADSEDDKEIFLDALNYVTTGETREIKHPEEEEKQN